MDKNYFGKLLKTEPPDVQGKYMYLVDNMDIALSIIGIGFRALYIAFEEGSYYTVDSFISKMDNVMYKGTYQMDYVYIPALSIKQSNDKLEQYFKHNHIDYHAGWQLFKHKEYLTKSEYGGELKKTLLDFVTRYEGRQCIQNADCSITATASITTEQDVLSLLACKKDSKGDNKVLQTVRNCETVLDNDSRLVGKIRYDEFSQQTFLFGKMPWTVTDNYRAWNSFDDSALFAILQADYGLNSRNDCYDALKNVSMRNRYHPVRDMLDTLEWDEKEHIRLLLPDYLGAEDTEYNYAVMRLLMLGAVARIYKPGTKFDYTPIFSGKQGLGKSTFLRLLALKDEWFNDSLDSLDSDKAAQSLLGSWIIELAELKSLARTVGGVESVKRFLSSTQDKYRVPYERRADIFLRQCVFCGTTNKSDFLQDETGNRRFLVVQVGTKEVRKDIFAPRAIEDIKAAWAEAVHIYKTGDVQLVLPRSCKEEAQRLQDSSMSDDGKIGIITEYLADKQRTCALEIWQEALHENGRPQKWQASEINNVIAGLPNWKKISCPTKFGRYGSQRGFQRIVGTEECSSDFVAITNDGLENLPFE